MLMLYSTTFTNLSLQLLPPNSDVWSWALHSAVALLWNDGDNPVSEDWNQCWRTESSLPCILSMAITYDCTPWLRYLLNVTHYVLEIPVELAISNPAQQWWSFLFTRLTNYEPVLACNKILGSHQSEGTKRFLHVVQFRIRKAGYPIRHTFANLVARYYMLVKGMKVTGGESDKAKCSRILSVALKDELWQIGKTKIFLKVSSARLLCQRVHAFAFNAMYLLQYFAEMLGFKPCNCLDLAKGNIWSTCCQLDLP